jgi:hypothetical protein
MAERGRAEEKTGGGSLGLIDIRKGPIRWINVRKVVRHHGRMFDYFFDYGVPDPRLGPYLQKPRIRSVRTKDFPLVGRVIDLHWKGRDFGVGIISRLNSDFKLKQPIMRGQDVEIRAHGDSRCWIISTETRDPPSQELWNCYQAIAQHFLAEWTRE